MIVGFMQYDPDDDKDWQDFQQDLYQDLTDYSNAMAHASNDGWFYDDGDSPPNSDLDYPVCPPPF